MSWIVLVQLVAGFTILILGAELLVRGASGIAMALGISPLVIGLTVVAFGTSSPELAVSIFSAYEGQAGIALGNVVGSNICNVLLILGLSALAAPLLVSRQIIRLEVPIMIGITLIFLLFAINGVLGRLEGLFLFSGAVFYVAWTVRRSRRESREESEASIPEDGVGSSRLVQVLQILGGLAMLALGSKWLVDGAVTVAQFFGVSDLVIGLTVVAIGTSLPELATSILASLRGQRDIAVGNIVGSNIFNILVVLGLTASVAPFGIPIPKSALTFDLPVMFMATVVCLPIFLTGHRIARWEGGLFFLYYLAYMLFIVLTALEHQAVSFLTHAMVGFVVPLTAITLIVSLWRHFKKRKTRL